MATGRPNLTVYYDGWCPLCTGIRRRMERIDWLGLVEFASMREAGVSERLGIPAQQLAERMHAVSHRTGRLVDGIDAVAAIAARVPVLWPLYPLIRLSAWTGLGQALYDFIARRRAIIPVGTCDEQGCPIHPPGG